MLAPVLTRLEEAGLLLRTEHDELVPNREPARIRMLDVLAAVRDPHHPDPVLAVTWPPAARDLDERISAAIRRELRDETLGSAGDGPAHGPVHGDG